MRKRLFICTGLLWAVVLGSIGLLYAQVEQWEELLKKDPENQELLMNLGKHYHDLGGMEKNKEAVKKAEEYLSKLLELEPDDCIAMAYYGSVLTMKARDAFFPWDKLKYLKKGITRMDKAVLLAPDDAEVRLIRAINSASMPKSVGRLYLALEDFHHIEKLHREHPLEMTTMFWLPYNYNYGLALLKNGDSEAAKEKFLKTIEMDPESDYAAYARRDLKKLEESSEDK